MTIQPHSTISIPHPPHSTISIINLSDLFFSVVLVFILLSYTL